MAIDPDGEATDTEPTQTGLSQTQNVDRSGEHAANTPVENLQKGSPLGRYLILETLGKGGMGVVYAAYDPELDRKVALKLVRGASGGTGASRESAESSSGTLRLMREAQAMAKVVHPNVCTVHEVGTWHGRVFLAMERVDGTDLEEWLKAAPRSWQEVLDVFVSAGHGLAAAHDVGLVHRDFKPENVLVGKDGRPRVTDFGLVRHAGEKGARQGPEWSTPIDGAAVTEAGVVMGTPAFMAPEQMEGVAATPAADQFSFAVSLWHAIYRQKPFGGRTMEEIHGEIEHGRLQPPPPGLKVPKYLQRVLTRALQYEPAKRFGSMRELLVALESDPAVKLRRGLAYAAVAALVLAFPLSFAVYKWRDAHRCERVGAELTGVWDDARRAQLKARFESWGAPGMAELPAAMKWLETYSQLWLRERARACELERKGEEDPRLIAARDACVARRRVRLKATVDTLLKADAASAEQARMSFAKMGMVKACQGPQARDRGLDESSDVAVKVQEQISQAELLALLGRVNEAQAVAKQAADAATKEGQHRLASEGWTALANSYDEAAGSEVQIDARKKALLEAEAGHEDEQVYDARLDLALALAYGTSKYEEALWLLEQAEATMTRLALPPERSAELYRVRAEVLEQAERPEEALPWAQKAYETIDSAAEDPYEEFRQLQTLTNVKADLGDVIGSEPLYEKLVAMEQERGETADVQQHLQLYLAEELMYLGRYRESLPYFDRAYLPGRAHWHAVDNAAAAGWGAYACAALGDFDCAKQKLELAGAERPAMTRPAAIVEPLLGKARVELLSGDYPAVAATVKDVRAVLETVADANRAPLLDVRFDLIEALRRQGRLEEAYLELRPALAGAVLADDPVEMAQVRAIDVRLKLEQGVSVPNAVEVLDEARTTIEKYEGTRTPSLVPVLSALATARRKAGDAGGERKVLEAALELAKNAPGDRFALAEASHALALPLARSGDAEKAKQLEEDALKQLTALGADLPLRRELEAAAKKLRR